MRKIFINPYEAPDNADLVLDTENKSLNENVAKVLEFLKSKNLL